MTPVVRGKSKVPDPLEWKDEDGDGARLSHDPEELDYDAIAVLSIAERGRDPRAVYVDEGDALAIIDWLQGLVRATS